MRKTMAVVMFLLLAAACLFSVSRAQTPAAPPSASVASYNATAQTANISATTFYTVPASTGFGPAPLQGKYEMKCYVVETTAGSSSSTLPSCGVKWTDSDSATAETLNTVSATNTGNTVGSYAAGSQIISPAAGSVVQILTASYASSAAGMAYTVRASLTYIGN